MLLESEYHKAAVKKKSVLIFSALTDESTIEVIKWLKFYNKEFIIIQSIDDFHLHNVSISQSYFDDNISAIWFRKLKLNPQRINVKPTEFQQTSYNFLQSELKWFYFSIEVFFKNIKSLGSGFNKMDLNKIEVLLKAQKLGIDTPNFLLTTKKTELVEFKNKYTSIITKPIYNTGVIKFNESHSGVMYTKIVTDDVMDEVTDTFFPSFFQECIFKEYEVRVFYLDGSFYSSAIFTNNDDVNIDYRDKRTNKIRSITYQLPKDIEKKLVQLMKKLNLNTGSIDLIKCKSGKYYFLEINPCGIYEGISNACNYNLNKKIAEWLIN